jgi:hypothetical protein
MNIIKISTIFISMFQTPIDMPNHKGCLNIRHKNVPRIGNDNSIDLTGNSAFVGQKRFFVRFWNLSVLNKVA